jgi:hypothetical protein
MDLARFMSSLFGRLLRIVAGIALAIVGLAAVQGVIGIILAIIGVVVFAAGAANFCIFAPLVGGPFWAKDIK